MPQKTIMSLAALLALSHGVSFAQSGKPLKEAIDISAAEVKEVLKHAPPAVDQQLKVVDLGAYNPSSRSLVGPR
jgi:hypothetical protein